MSPIADDRLRLIFTCCHPALPMVARVGLTLRTLGGLTTPEISRAFLIPETTLMPDEPEVLGLLATGALEATDYAASPASRAWFAYASARAGPPVRRRNARGAANQVALGQLHAFATVLRIAARSGARPWTVL